jgi:hypothetical protein
MKLSAQQSLYDICFQLCLSSDAGERNTGSDVCCPGGRWGGRGGANHIKRNLRDAYTWRDARTANNAQNIHGNKPLLGSRKL